MCLSVKNHAIIFDSTVGDEYLLTIAIPTFNRFDLLKEALASVFRQQLPFPVEVLVVDNCPDTIGFAKELVMEFKTQHFRYVVNDENLGMFGNWNQCLLLSRGRYMMILNDDDLLKSNFSNILPEYIGDGLIDGGIISFLDDVLDQRNPAIKRTAPIWLKAARTFKSIAKEKIFRARTVSQILRTDLFFKNYIHGTLGVVFDRQNAILLGGFNADTYPVADWDFWLRWASECGPIKRVNHSVAVYRIKENESLNPETLAKFPPAVRKMRELSIMAGRLPSFLSVCIPYLDKYEVMLGIMGFGDPRKYKVGLAKSLSFYCSMYSQSLFAYILAIVYRK